MDFNVYAVICILSVVMLVLLIRAGHRQNITDYLVIFGFIMISCMGYYIMSFSAIPASMESIGYFWHNSSR